MIKWNYLFSEEADKTKKEVLKYIRNKSAYHIVPETIKGFMDIEKDKRHNVKLFEMFSQVEGYSPLVTSILSYQLFEKLLSKPKEGIVSKVQMNKIVKLQDSLQAVLVSLLSDEFEINL